MSPPSSGSRRQLRWPLLLLLASLSVTAVAAFQAQRAASSHRRTAERLLHDYAAFAAWSYTRHAQDALTAAAWQVLNPILHRHLHDLSEWPDAEDLARYRDTSLAECQCDPSYRPGTYLAWSVGTDTLGTAGEPLDDRTRRWLVDTLNRHIRDPRQPRSRAALVALPRGPSAVLVAYGLMPMARGDTIAYAFTFEPHSLTRVFQDAAEQHDLLPPTVALGRPGSEVLALRVTAPGGVVLFASPGYPARGWDASDAMPALVGGLAVRATVRPELAGALMDGGLPRSRLPMLLVLVAMAAALSLVAVRQMRREQELARLRSDFVAGVSHELRTPLAQIRLFLETLRLGRFRTETERSWLLGHVERETTRLDHLIENVLAFARLGRTADEPAPPLQTADVSAEVAAAVRLFEPLAALRHVTVLLQVDDPATALLHAPSFRQLVLNLLDNAVKYGPAEQTVTVRVTAGADAVRLSVADEGPGVPPAERARVWEPFFRGQDDAVRAVGGSGIGLAIVREIARRHQATVRLQQAASGGALFIVELPAASAAGAAPTSTPDADHPPAPRPEPAEVG